MSPITITPQTPLDLFLVVKTMTQERRKDYGRDGIAAMSALKAANADPFTVSVHLVNRVVHEGSIREVLVYEMVDTSGMPRWTAGGQGRKDREKLERTLTEAQNATPLTEDQVVLAQQVPEGEA